MNGRFVDDGRISADEVRALLDAAALVRPGRSRASLVEQSLLASSLAA
jgi:hypothetical protein